MTNNGNVREALKRELVVAMLMRKLIMKKTYMSAEMGGNAKNSMIGRKVSIKGKSEETNEKAYEMGGHPKDCMGEGKQIRKNNTSVPIKETNDQEEQLRNDTSENVNDMKKDTKDALVDKTTNILKGAKDKVVGTMKEAKKSVQGYADAVKPSEENRDKEVDQTDIDVERRPHDEEVPLKERVTFLS